MPRSTVLVVAFLVGAAALTLSWLLSGLLVGGSLLAVKGQQVVQEGEAAQEARRLAEAQARLAAARQGREGEAQAARALARVRKIRDEHKLPIAPWAEIPEPRPPKQPPRSRSPVPEQWIHNPERLPSPERSKLAAAYAPLGLLWRGEYAKLDATLDAWHPLPREASALSPIELALAHLETVRGRRSDLARWLEARPDSYWARVLLARSLFGLSHEFRSSAFNHRLRPERMEAAMAVAQRGVDLLFEAARTAPERAYHWQTLYKYQRHLGVVDLPEDLASLPPGAPDPPQTLVLGARAPPAVPDTYLVDVLQRVGQHPANRVEELTPRRWKPLFANDPLRSDLTLP